MIIHTYDSSTLNSNTNHTKHISNPLTNLKTWHVCVCVCARITCDDIIIMLLLLLCVSGVIVVIYNVAFVETTRTATQHATVISVILFIFSHVFLFDHKTFVLKVRSVLLCWYGSVNSYLLSKSTYILMIVCFRVRASACYKKRRRCPDD